MKNLTLALGSIGLLFILNGCCEDRVEYVKVPCPTLQTFEYTKRNFEPLVLDYEVIKNDKD